MPRLLLLVRHAKSSWDDPSLSDHERPLAPRGIKALQKMRRHLESNPARPEIVLCSPAVRTRETLDGIRPALPPDVEIRYEETIYGASVPTLISRIAAQDDDVGCLMVVGHNPGLEDLALALVNDGDPGLRQQLWEKFPTGTIATLALDESWSGLEPASARLDDLFLPRPPR